jgi:hypothetical protein
MRMLLRVKIPVETGNQTISNGRLPQLMEQTLAELKPEAAYFTADAGCRTAFIVFDLKDTSDIPKIAEPFFMELNAEIEMAPVMNADDLKKGLSHLKALK